MNLLLALTLFAVLPSSARTQYVPRPSYENVLGSLLNENVSISYKEPPAGTCTTAFSAQMQYTGYINLPPFTLAPIQQTYSINTFFWFFEAREKPDTAPLTIFLSGGPGVSSMFALFNEVGPCEVVQTEDGSYGTRVKKWGWDRTSNMLFIDQPNQVGFSFDTAMNASFDFYTGESFEPPTLHSQDLPHYMYLNGTFGTASLNGAKLSASTANTTEIAAEATWHFLQAWLSAFPHYNPATRPNVTTSSGMSNDSVGVNLFTESYSGKYGPVFAIFFEKQNQAIVDGLIPSDTALTIKLDTVGILNGKIDDLVQDYYYPAFAYNNTYGIQAIDQVDELNEINAFTTNCVTQIQQCRAVMASTDPEGYGDVDSTNDLCAQAQSTCNAIISTYIAKGYYPYDIRQTYPSPDPPAAYQEYLNHWSVLSAIGAHVNYTESNEYVLDGFIATGDTIRGGTIDDLAYLLTIGVRVALIYGDADYICNWYGGQAVSLAIADLLPNYPDEIGEAPGQPPPISYAAGFSAAGYADVVVNQSYVGGVTRQYGNLSFTRIYGAGHFVPYFQPETAFTVFTRIIQGTDLSMGKDLASSGTKGPTNATYSNTAAYSASPTCWIRSWNQSCSDDDTNAMFEGTGVVANGIYYQNSKQTTSGLPSRTVSAGKPGHPISAIPGSESVLTGVYTATSTPKQSSGAISTFTKPPLLEWQMTRLSLISFGFAVGPLLIL